MVVYAVMFMKAQICQHFVKRVLLVKADSRLLKFNSSANDCFQLNSQFQDLSAGGNETVSLLLSGVNSALNYHIYSFDLSLIMVLLLLKQKFFLTL